KPQAERRELLRRLLQCPSRLEPSDPFDEMRAAAVLVEVPLQPQPDIDIVWKVESRRHYAGNRVLAVVDVKHSADDLRVGVVVLSPQPVADHGNRVARVERTIVRESGTDCRAN